MDASVVVAAQADEVGQHGRPAVGVEDDVVDVLDALPTAGESAVHIAHEDRAPQGTVQHAHLRHHRDQPTMTIDEQGSQGCIAGQLSRGLAANECRRDAESLQPRSLG